MHHRRKLDRPLTTRGTISRIATIRLPYDLEEAIKEEAGIRGRPWQTTLKEILRESLGLTESAAEVKRIPATAFRTATKQLRRK